MLENFGLQVNNLEPTRVTATTSTCIDHMISNSQYENKTIESNIQKKNQLFEQWIKRPSTENRDKYKTQRNVCDKTIRNAKIAFYDQKTTNMGNSKKIFSILRNLWSKTRLNTYCKLTADDFNDFFSIIGEKLANNFGENLQIKSNRFEKTFVFNPLTINETSTAIKNLENSKSVGHDGISNITLKQALSVISQPLN